MPRPASESWSPIQSRIPAYKAVSHLRLLPTANSPSGSNQPTNPNRAQHPEGPQSREGATSPVLASLEPPTPTDLPSARARPRVPAESGPGWLHKARRPTRGILRDVLRHRGVPAQPRPAPGAHQLSSPSS
uniref:Putative uncharacterized protein ST20-AS1 n=1 Tax=Homo sapiens TaxID=9606 RepID=STAS1_HUMAN